MDSVTCSHIMAAVKSSEQVRRLKCSSVNDELSRCGRLSRSIVTKNVSYERF